MVRRAAGGLRIGRQGCYRDRDTQQQDDPTKKKLPATVKMPKKQKTEQDKHYPAKDSPQSRSPWRPHNMRAIPTTQKTSNAQPDAQRRGTRHTRRKKKICRPRRRQINQCFYQCCRPKFPVYKYLQDTLRAVKTAVRTKASQGWVKLQERRHSAVLHGSTGGERRLGGSSGIQKK